MNAADILRAMQADPIRIVQHLLPGGRKVGTEWRCGSTAGDAGKSLGVSLKGAKPLVWMDGATGEKGGGIDLWMTVRGLSLLAALDDIRQYLGLHDVAFASMPAARSYRRPIPAPGLVMNDDRVLAWFAARGIETATVRRWRVRGLQIARDFYLAWPAKTREHGLENVKFRNIADKTDMRQEAGCAPALIGKHLIDENTHQLVIAEGEPDAMVFDQMHIPAVSVPSGAAGMEWIEREWLWLERFTDIVIAFDNDEAGNKGAAEAMRRLGHERTRRLVVRVGKDANDWLRAGAGCADFHAAVAAAEPYRPPELRCASEYMEDVIALLYPDPALPSDPTLELDQAWEWFNFRDGEVSLYTGINGHGKSLLLSQVQLGLMRQGVVMCQFSGEMAPKRLLLRMARQATGLATPTRNYVHAVGQWLADKLYLFCDVDGNTSVKLARLLEVFAYAARRYNVKHFVLDSLMKTDVPDDGPGALSKQREAMNAICNFAHRHKCHVHIVAHPRKDRDESSAPGKMDVSGSGRIVDQVDNLFSVWRKPAELVEKEPEKPVGTLRLLKQRNGDMQDAKLSLYYDSASMQFRTTSRLWRTRRYVEFDGAPVYAAQPEPEASDEVPEEDRF